MRISASTGTGHGPGNAAAGARGKADAPVRAALPALVPQPDRPPEADRGPRGRALTSLLAQLIGGAEDLPATRARRRADPEFGAECYRTIARLGAAKTLAKVRMI